jgi:hypothetical protein
MCLVIDTCCLLTVFDAKNKRHAKFAPVMNWLNSKGRLIYGGTKYNQELGRLSRILSLVVELSKRRKTVRMSNDVVDPIATELKVKFPEPEFNDEHIVALVIASRCCVVCTDDSVAISYLRRVDVFRDYEVKRPSIYRGHKSNKALCCDKHLVKACLGE